MTRRTARSRSPKPVTVSGRHSKTARRITGGLALLFALVAMGLVYSALQPHPQTASAAPATAQDIAQGKALFQGNTCITCHGANLQGVTGRGPSLVGVGQAAVYFQVSTGRMPLAAQGAQSPRKDPLFSEDQIQDIGAYVESNGGGPAVPDVADSALIDTANLSKGADLYRLNCASCHNFTGQGGALSQGKYAPALDSATSKQIYAAMLSGPENMPQFSDGQLTPTEKKAIITYVQNTKATVDPGGYDLGGFGPAPEGLAAFLIGMGALVALTLWMGARA
jgi:ubiquinol-cytochrome c reductase cytochrome c subunit